VHTVAIDDIVARIAADSEAEASALLAEAEADAARTRADAEASADADAARTLASTRASTERDAATLVANARLEARDAMLAARLALVEEGLAGAHDALVGLPDSEYAGVLSRQIADSSSGSEVVVLGSADGERLRAWLPAAMLEAGVALQIVDGDAGMDRGVALVGDGVRVEVSPAAMIAGRRDELVALVDRVLSGREGAGQP
jgi:vacuolar-type H+-ATPase subunit E/Vma4